jgi:hypothetical protein
LITAVRAVGYVSGLVPSSMGTAGAAGDRRVAADARWCGCLSTEPAPGGDTSTFRGAGDDDQEAAGTRPGDSPVPVASMSV